MQASSVLRLNVTCRQVPIVSFSLLLPPPLPPLPLPYKQNVEQVEKGYRNIAAKTKEMLESVKHVRFK